MINTNTYKFEVYINKIKEKEEIFKSAEDLIQKYYDLYNSEQTRIDDIYYIFSINSDVFLIYCEDDFIGELNINLVRKYKELQDIFKENAEFLSYLYLNDNTFTITHDVHFSNLSYAKFKDKIISVDDLGSYVIKTVVSVEDSNYIYLFYIAENGDLFDAYKYLRIDLLDYFFISPYKDTIFIFSNKDYNSILKNIID